MFINSINQTKEMHSISMRNKISINSYNNKTGNNVNFKAGPNITVLENKAKILASLDIMSKSPKIKMPNSDIEKKAVLEVLGQRLKLNKYIKLKADERSIQSKINEINELIDNSKFVEAKAMLDNLDKQGNIDSILKTIRKQIEQEEKRNQPAIKYFEDLNNLMQEYLDKKLINYNQLDSAWHQIRKNDINSNGNLSPAELIEIVSSGNTDEKVTNAKPRISSRKDLLNILEKEYEELMRKGVNVYATSRENEEINNQYDKSRNIRYLLNEKYGNIIKKFPGIEEALKGIYAKVEKKYSFKVNQLTDVQIHPIGQIWDQMKDVENFIKNTMKEIPILKEKLEKDPTNKVLEMELTAKEVLLNELRADWLRGAKLSVDYEAINRQNMIDAGRINEYDYLVSENKTLNLHKQALKIYNENNETIPEEIWNELIK